MSKLSSFSMGREGVSRVRLLVGGKYCFWDYKKVAAGRVRGVAAGRGVNYRVKTVRAS